MIAERIAKLKFIVEEMQIAFHLAKHAPDDFVARTLARHILIRAKDFIEHARGLKRYLNSNALDTKRFNEAKETYAKYFDEYFQISRNRLSAHVQDLDFAKRIELWNDIEIDKIDFFVDAAKEIYQSLAALNLQGYVAYIDPTELTDPSLNMTLLEFKSSESSRDRAEVAADSLALTRENTSAALNLTPVHSRAAQLALIRRWIKIQDDLLQKLLSHPRLARILKARILTDIVSFCDCLVTRHVPVGTPQDMNGLDYLISEGGESPAPINDLVVVTNFHIELEAVRSIRNQIGSHLEIKNACTLNSLIADLDNYDLGQGRVFYELAERAFVKTCLNIHYLRLYAADGQRMYGVTLGGSQAFVPFTADTLPAPMVAPQPQLINDTESYQQNLKQWLYGNDEQKGEARHFFFQAFMHSEMVEQISETEIVGLGRRFSKHEFRKAHQFFSFALTRDIPDYEFFHIIDLLLSCKSGSPYPLTELLLRSSRAATENRKLLICYGLGEIASWSNSSATEFIDSCSKSVIRDLRLVATLALFKIFVRSEGIFRLNNRGREIANYSAFVEDLMAQIPTHELLLYSLAFASILSGASLGHLAKPFAEDYKTIQEQIEILCNPYFKDDAACTQKTTLSLLIQSHDYVGICVLLAVDLKDEADSQQLREELINGCCDGSIVTANHDQASHHLAMCFLLKKEHAIALEIAGGITERNPECVDAQILVAEIMGEMHGLEDEATRKVAYIRLLYKLETVDETRLNTVLREIEERKAS